MTFFSAAVGGALIGLALGVWLGLFLFRRLPDIQLRDKNKDLANQVEELRKARPFTEGEQKAISAIRAAHDAIKEQQDKIALWLRENKKEEIQRGDHKGKSFSEVVIRYMGLEKFETDAAYNRGRSDAIREIKSAITVDRGGDV